MAHHGTHRVVISVCAVPRDARMYRFGGMMILLGMIDGGYLWLGGMEREAEHLNSKARAYGNLTI
jgi:hypothetical protein